MKSFFRQIEDVSLDNSPVTVEVYFGGENSAALFEKQIDAERGAVMLLAGGEPKAAYLLENDHSRHISLGEFSSLESARIRRIIMPDVAGRLILLALESQIGRKFPNMDGQAWDLQTAQWKRDEWSGLVEINSKKLHGFALFWHGEPQELDSVHATSRGFISGLPKFEDEGYPAFEVVSFVHPASAQSYQCAVLRQGARRWSRGILSRYHEMVGQKLLQMLDRELNRQVQPWKISLVEKDLVDLHLFPHLMDAAHVYRSLFMAMGAQMDFVIGNTLTRRLLDESFDQIHPEERAVLLSQRLIPAAFTE